MLTATVTGRKNCFISSAFRVELILNHSSIVKKVIRCASVYSEITGKMAEANRNDDKGKFTMSKHAEHIGRLEIQVRAIIMRVDSCEALLVIATILVLVLVGKVRVATPPLQNTNKDIAHAAIHKCVNEFTQELPGSLPFILNTLEEVKQFCVKPQTA